MWIVINNIYLLLSTNLQCADIDECALGQDNCDHICTNTNSSFQCSCFSGFILINGSLCIGKEYKMQMFVIHQDSINSLQTLTLRRPLSHICDIWPNWLLWSIIKYDSCSFSTLILKKNTPLNLFIFNFRNYLVLCMPYISQCIDLNWKALMLISPNNSCAVRVTMVL